MYSIFYTTETMHGFFPVFQKFIFKSCIVSVVWISVVENTVLVELQKMNVGFCPIKGDNLLNDILNLQKKFWKKISVPFRDMECNGFSK